MHFGILVFQRILRRGNIHPIRVTEAPMSIHQPVASNVRNVTCDGYWEEIETLARKQALSEASSNRDAKIRHDPNQSCSGIRVSTIARSASSATAPLTCPKR